MDPIKFRIKQVVIPIVHEDLGETRKIVFRSQSYRKDREALADVQTIGDDEASAFALLEKNLSNIVSDKDDVNWILDNFDKFDIIEIIKTAMIEMRNNATRKDAIKKHPLKNVSNG